MTFAELAARAVEQEKLGSYGVAAQLWISANKHARKTENKEWAANRANYCNRRYATQYREAA